MYNKIVKNNQVTYGMPFQLKISANPYNIKIQEEIAATNEDAPQSMDYDAASEIVARAKEEAEMIIKEAEYEAAKIIESAENEANVRAAEIQDKAWQAGYSEGNETARAQNEALLQETQNIRNSAIAEHDRTIACMEEEIIEMTIDISKKVIGVEFQTNPENMLSIVKQALEKCSNRNDMTIKVAKEDYSFLNANMDKLLSMVQGVGEVAIKQDLSLKPGDCIVETPFGSVDAGMQTKLVKIEQAFRELMEDRAVYVEE